MDINFANKKNKIIEPADKPIADIFQKFNTMK